MFRLLYISTARVEPTSEELDRILVTSRRNNAVAGITGMLVTGGRRFLQVLEGPADAVTATYDRIREDPRHFAVVELARGPVADRSFGTWLMGSATGRLGATGTTDPAGVIAGIADPNLRAYFSGFVEKHAA